MIILPEGWSRGLEWKTNTQIKKNKKRKSKKAHYRHKVNQRVEIRFYFFNGPKKSTIKSRKTNLTHRTASETVLCPWTNENGGWKRIRESCRKTIKIGRKLAKWEPSEGDQAHYVEILFWFLDLQLRFSSPELLLSNLKYHKPNKGTFYDS